MKPTTIITGIVLAIASAQPAMAQSKVQCNVDEEGRVTAALVWQNTLGAARANSICNTQAKTMARVQSATSEKNQGVETGGAQVESHVSIVGASTPQENAPARQDLANMGTGYGAVPPGFNPMW